MLGLGFRIGTVASVLALLSVPVSPALKPFGRIGTNPNSQNKTYYGSDCPWLDRFKTSEVIKAGNNGTITLNADGWPTACSTYAETYFFTERFNGSTAQQRYVLLTNKNWSLNPGNGVVSTNTINNGSLRRVVFDLTDFLAPNSPAHYVRFGGINDDPWRDGDTFAIVRLDEEPRFLAGFLYRQQYLDIMAPYGVLRFMDWCAVNGDLGSITSMAQWARPSAASFIERVPVEYMVGLANELDVAPWLTIPHGFGLAAVREMAGIVKNGRGGYAGLDPHLRSVWQTSNETWNYQSPEIVQAAHFEYIQNPDTDQRVSTDFFVGYGWATTLNMMTVLDVFNYDEGVCCFFGSQNTNAGVTLPVIDGINLALAQVADTKSVLYNPIWSAKFHEVKDVFSSWGGANYWFGDIIDVYKNGSSADKATIDTVAAATDGSGVTAAINQIRYGNLLTATQHANIADCVSAFSQQQAIARQIGVPQVAYEGGESLEGSASCGPAIHALAIAVAHDPRSIQLGKDYIQASRAAGFKMMADLCDMSDLGGDFGKLEGGPNDLTWARYLAIVQASAEQGTWTPSLRGSG